MEKEKLTFRDTDKLYASVKTVECAQGMSTTRRTNGDDDPQHNRRPATTKPKSVVLGGCVPCAYKIGGFHTTRDPTFCRACPNQRPEQCPRSGSVSTGDAIAGYAPGMAVLTVGDGDFSFSLSLARRLLWGQKSHTQRTFLVATSYEKESTLEGVYGNTFRQTVEELQTLGVHLAYEVDATRLDETLPVSLLWEGYQGKDAKRRLFHRICWNFPCTAIAEGQDGQNQEMEDNKSLIRRFIRSAGALLVRGCGEIHICHKTKPPYNQWKLEEQVALGLKVHQSRDDKSTFPNLTYTGRIVLDRYLMPPYTPRKALDQKSFPCHDACFYIFAAEHEKEKNGDDLQPSDSFPPTIPHQVDGSESEDDQESETKLLVKVDYDLIQSIREQHLADAAVTKRFGHRMAKTKRKNKNWNTSAHMPQKRKKTQRR